MRKETHWEFFKLQKKKNIYIKQNNYMDEYILASSNFMLCKLYTYVTKNVYYNIKKFLIQ